MELEGEIGSASQALDNQQVAKATARASELPVLIINGANSPRSRIGRGLESIGSMTSETLQRISTTVGGVVKSPVVLMAKVGGLASPQATTLTTPLGSCLEDRMYHLEIQMKSLEEKFNSMTVVTELDLSTRSCKEKPRIAKSLLQEMETNTMLEKRVQILEDRINERMERFEKVLSSIQFRLDHVEFSKHESVAMYEHQEGLPSEPQYYDAEQQSDNFEALEAVEHNFFGAQDGLGEATRGSPTLEKSHVKETLSTAPTTTEHIEPLQEIDAGKNDDFLEPQVVSTPVYSKEAFLTQPMKSVAPSSEPAESVHRNDAGNLPASLDRQLASTLEELHGSFVTESSAAAASAKFLEIARAATVEKSTLVHASLEPQSGSVLEEPWEAFLEEPSAAVQVAKFEEHAQEDVADKSGTTIAAMELPSPPTFEATEKDFTKELLAVAPNAKLAQELATQGVVIIALASSEPPMTSKFVEEPLVVVPSANSEESTQEDTSDKNVTMTTAGESPKAFSFQDPQEDFVKESLGGAPSARPAHEPSSLEDLSTTSDMALASSQSLVASKSVEDPLVVAPGVNFEELAQEDVVGKSGNMIAATELPLASSLEEPQEKSVKEFMVAVPSIESTKALTTQEDNDMQVVAPKSQMEFKFVEEPSSIAPSADSEEPAQEDVAGKTGTMMATTKSSLPSSLEESKEGFEKEFMASALSGKPTQEHSDMAIASSKTEGASQFVKEASATAPSANFGEREYKANANESGTIIVGAESPLVSSFDDPQEDFEKESLAAAPSVELAQELATQEDSIMALASLETTMKSKFAEDPSTTVASANFEEHTREDADKGVTMTVAADSPLASSYQDSQEDFEKDSLAVAPSGGPIHEPSLQEDLGATSDKALASFEPQVASKFVEEPSSVVPSANFEEPVEEDDGVKSDTVIAGVKSPLASSFEEPQEDFEKESLAAKSSRKPVQELATKEDSHMVPTSSESQEASKFVEEPSTTVPSADCGKPTHEDAIDKSVAMTTIGVSPFTSSFEGPQEDSEKESIATTPSNEPTQELAIQEDSDMASSKPQVASKFVEEPSATNVPSAKFEELAYEDTIDMSGFVTAAVESPSVSSVEAHMKDYRKESLAAGTSAKVLEPTEEDEFGKSPLAFALLEAPSTPFFGIPQEAFSKEPSETSIQLEEPAQEKSLIMLPNAESTLTSTVEEGNHAAKEAEYKLAEDFKVHHKHIKSIEKEFPRSQSNLAHVGSDESVAEDSDDRLESDQSGEEFFDAEYGSGNFEPSEFDEPKSFEEFGVGPDELSEATGINVVAQKATLVPVSSVERAQEPEQALARELAQELEQRPARELEQEPDQTPALNHESGEQAHAQEHEQQPVQEQEQHAHGQQPVQEHKQHSEQEPEEWPAQEHGQQPVQELGHKPEQQSEQPPAQKVEQEDLTRNSIVALPPSEPQVTSKSGESPELLAEEPLAAVPNTKFEEPPQANAVDESGTRDLPLTSSTKEPQIDIVVSLEKSLSSASFHQSGNPELLEHLKHKSLDTLGSTSSTPQEALERESLIDAPTTEIAQGHDVGKSGAILASSELQLTPTLEEPQEGFVKELLVDAESTSKSMDLDKSLVDEPSVVTTNAMLAQKSVADKISVGLVEESPLTSIVEEPQNGNVSSLVEGKHGEEEADQKFLEVVKIVVKPTEVAIPRTQSDLTHAKLNPEAADDTSKLQSQGSFLAFGATSVDSKEALVKEPLPSTKLLELFEEENNSGKRGPVLANSPMTSTVEEPQKPLVEEPLASAKLVPKGHARRRGFARSSSEPQFAYKVEEHRKALAKESSVAAIPSTSKLGEEHAQEDFDDTQCLPFKILGEGKHPRKESEFKLVEDVKSPATKSETTSSPYVLEPKPSKIKEKKKKEKKERKLDATAEEKERRLSLGSGEIERKSSLRAEEKDSKYSPRIEEKHKQPFRHLRDRLRHAFSVNKEP